MVGRRFPPGLGVIHAIDIMFLSHPERPEGPGPMTVRQPT
jgi:hypothetical protein